MAKPLLIGQSLTPLSQSMLAARRTTDWPLPTADMRTKLPDDAEVWQNTHKEEFERP